MNPSVSPPRVEVILPQHLSRAVAVCGEREDTGVLLALAISLGWPAGREVTVVPSETEGVALQGLVGAAVAGGGLGLVLVADLAELLGGEDAARLLDLCALYDTLVGDPGGVYDPASPEDRGALGVTTLQERSLEQRLRRGRLRKARRGELGVRVPTGYSRDADGGVILDPVVEVREAVKEVFALFEASGNISEVLATLKRRGSKLGFRSPSAGESSKLTWRPANRQTLRNLLRNPTYTGAYVYGRRTDREPTDQGAWKVCIRDHHPAYLVWETFEENVRLLSASRSSASTPGTVRGGTALLTGLVYCGRCGRRMAAQYPSGAGRYVCTGERSERGAGNCQSLAARTLDQSVLEAARATLAPEVIAARTHEEATPESSEERQLQARLDWARRQASVAERRYLAVEPDSVQVARSLEREWEARLRELQVIEGELKGWRRRHHSAASGVMLTRLAAEIVDGWAAISPERRKRLVRQLIERVEVKVEGESERVSVTLRWRWGEATSHETLRPVARWEQMSTWPALVARLKDNKAQGMTARAISGLLNAEGWHTPRLKGSITPEMVRSLLSRHKITAIRRGEALEPGVLGLNEWWLPQLAEELKVPTSTLYGWLRRGQLKARQLHGDQGRWVINMDPTERERLLALKSPRD